MPATPTLSADCQRWALTANYSLSTSDSGEMLLHSAAGHQGRFFIRRRGGDRLELTESDPETGGERPLLFVADIAVLERYLFGILATRSARIWDCRSWRCRRRGSGWPPGTPSAR